MRFLKILLSVFIFLLLTILTQIGGLILLLSFLLYRPVNKIRSNLWRRFLNIISFPVIYVLATFLIVPAVASHFGRIALPLSTSNNLRPLNFLTCLLNRHYVTPKLQAVVFRVAEKMNEKHPGTIVNYLDANFPFFDKFPLIPHLSHHDGKKIDIAFYYINKTTGQSTNQTPSFIGYGISEEPAANEDNTASFCDEKGYWQYSFMQKIIPQGKKAKFIFDKVRTKSLVNMFTTEAETSKVFIEPHLKKRLNLSSSKIRFHGCQAVRHDDHIHVQVD